MLGYFASLGKGGAKLHEAIATHANTPDEAIALRPAGRKSPVIMRPTLASGAATVRGTRTEILAEAADTGMTVEEIAEDFLLTPDEVRAALSYEWAEAV